MILLRALLAVLGTTGLLIMFAGVILGANYITDDEYKKAIVCGYICCGGILFAVFWFTVLGSIA